MDTSPSSLQFLSHPHLTFTINPFHLSIPFFSFQYNFVSTSLPASSAYTLVSPYFISYSSSFTPPAHHYDYLHLVFLCSLATFSSHSMSPFSFHYFFFFVFVFSFYFLFVPSFPCLPFVFSWWRGLKIVSRRNGKALNRQNLHQRPYIRLVRFEVTINHDCMKLKMAHLKPSSAVMMLIRGRFS